MAFISDVGEATRHGSVGYAGCMRMHQFTVHVLRAGQLQRGHDPKVEALLPAWICWSAESTETGQLGGAQLPDGQKAVRYTGG